MKYLTELPDVIAGLVLLVLAIVLGLLAILRYAFATGFPGLEELATIMFLWFAFLGAAVAARRQMHFRLGFLFARLPARQQRIVLLLAHTCTFVYATLLLWSGLALVVLTIDMQTGALSISRSVGYSSLAAGAALIVVYSVIHFAREARKL